MAEHQWYYAITGVQGGPISTEELCEMARTGRIKPSDAVWLEGTPDWVDASAVENLFAYAIAEPAQSSDSYDLVQGGAKKPAPGRSAENPLIELTSDPDVVEARRKKREEAEKQRRRRMEAEYDDFGERPRRRRKKRADFSWMLFLIPGVLVVGAIVALFFILPNLGGGYVTLAQIKSSNSDLGGVTRNDALGFQVKHPANAINQTEALRSAMGPSSSEFAIAGFSRAVQEGSGVYAISIETKSLLFASPELTIRKMFKDQGGNADFIKKSTKTILGKTCSNLTARGNARGTNMELELTIMPHKGVSIILMKLAIGSNAGANSLEQEVLNNISFFDPSEKEADNAKREKQ